MVFFRDGAHRLPPDVPYWDTPDVFHDYHVGVVAVGDGKPAGYKLNYFLILKIFCLVK